jgi:hypothetical protein
VEITWLYSIHHRMPRGMGGTSLDLNKTSNLVLLCGSGTSGCHGWIEHNRQEAREFGFLLNRNQDSTKIPIITSSGLQRYLDDSGHSHAAQETLDVQSGAGR